MSGHLTTKCEKLWGRNWWNCKEKTAKPTIVTGDINEFVLLTGRHSKQKISKDVVKLKRTINQLGFIDIYRTVQFYSVWVTAEYTFFSSSQNHSPRPPSAPAIIPLGIYRKELKPYVQTKLAHECVWQLCPDC